MSNPPRIVNEDTDFEDLVVSLAALAEQLPIDRSVSPAVVRCPTDRAGRTSLCNHLRKLSFTAMAVDNSLRRSLADTGSDDAWCGNVR